MCKYRELSFDCHIIGFCAQTERLDSPYKTPSNTLAVKGYLKVTAKFTFVIISVSVTIFFGH